VWVKISMISYYFMSKNVLKSVQRTRVKSVQKLVRRTTPT